jgi:hypothetical protein
MPMTEFDDADEAPPVATPRPGPEVGGLESIENLLGEEPTGRDDRRGGRGGRGRGRR